MHLDKYDLAAILLAVDLTRMEIDGESCLNYPTPEQVGVALVPAERIVEACRRRSEQDMRPIPILARNRSEAERFCLSWYSDVRLMDYIDGINAVRGRRFSKANLVYADGWRDNPNYDADFLAALEMALEPPKSPGELNG